MDRMDRDNYICDDDRLFHNLAYGIVANFDVKVESLRIYCARLAVAEHCFMDIECMEKVMAYHAEFGEFDEVDKYLDKGYPLTAEIFARGIKGGRITEEIARLYFHMLGASAQIFNVNLNHEGYMTELKDIRGRIFRSPIAMAARVGNEMCLKMLLNKDIDVNPILAALIFGGHVELFDFVVKNYGKPRFGYVLTAAKYSGNPHFLAACAKLGDVSSSFLTLHKRSHLCPRWAAYNGNVRALTTVGSKNLLPTVGSRSRDIAISKALAVANGKLKILKLMKSYPMGKSNSRREYYPTQNLPWSCVDVMNETELVAIAMVKGHIKILDWLFKTMDKENFEVYSRLYNLNLKIYEWLFKVGIISKPTIFRCAIRAGNLACAKKYATSINLCLADAIKSENFNLLKFLVQENILNEWGQVEYICRKIISAEILEWIYDNHGFNSKRLHKEALKHENYHILEWLKNNGFKNIGFETSSLPVFLWMVENCDAKVVKVGTGTSHIRHKRLEERGIRVICV